MIISAHQARLLKIQQRRGLYDLRKENPAKNDSNKTTPDSNTPQTNTSVNNSKQTEQEESTEGQQALSNYNQALVLQNSQNKNTVAQQSQAQTDNKTAQTEEVNNSKTEQKASNVNPKFEIEYDSGVTEAYEFLPDCTFTLTTNYPNGKTAVKKIDKNSSEFKTGLNMLVALAKKQKLNNYCLTEYANMTQVTLEMPDNNYIIITQLSNGKTTAGKIDKNSDKGKEMDREKKEIEKIKNDALILKNTFRVFS